MVVLMLPDIPIPEAPPILQLAPQPPIVELPAEMLVGGGVNPVKIEVMVGLGAIAPGVLTTGAEVPWGIGVAVLSISPGCRVAVGISI
jgi:hypothetical protein